MRTMPVLMGIRTLAIVVGLATCATNAWSAPAVPAPTPSSQLVTPQDFCLRLQTSFVAYAAAHDYSTTEAMRLADRGAAAVVEQLRTGRSVAYVNAAALAAYAQVPAKMSKDSYLSVARLIGAALGASDAVTLAQSPAELRYVPLAQRGVDIVVVATDADVLTSERARLVAVAAKSMDIKIYVVWVSGVGAASSEASGVEALVKIAAATGGAVVNLGGPETNNPCAPGN